MVKLDPKYIPNSRVCVYVDAFFVGSLKKSVVKATNKRPRLEILERSEEETGTLTNWTRGGGIFPLRDSTSAKGIKSIFIQESL